MVTKDFLDGLNAAYHQLELKMAQVCGALHHRIFELEPGWYNGHYRQDENGGWKRDSYPIPVVSVRDYCDIEISFDELSVSTKLKRAKALEYPYEKILQYNFEAFGVEDYLITFYKKGMSLDELKANISKSGEREIGFAFTFPFDVEGNDIFEFVKMLRREGFYY